MKTLWLLISGYCLLTGLNTYSQNIDISIGNLIPVDVAISNEIIKQKDAIKVIKNKEVTGVDQPTFAKIKGIQFKNGTIELKVLSKIAADNSFQGARGFIGVAFRINEDNSQFECFYLRPANARVDDQVRRNHTLQYFSFPDFPFSRFRKESPEKYESYADMALNEWITVKIVVRDARAQLFINDNPQPSLIVNDLMHGADRSGAIGLWVDVGTEGYFSDVRVSE